MTETPICCMTLLMHAPGSLVLARFAEKSMKLASFEAVAREQNRIEVKHLRMRLEDDAED